MEMTSRERIGRMYEHKEADRVPLFESPWGATTARWRAEGMGEANYVEFFGLDRIRGIGADNSPRLPVTTVEETDEYKITTNAWGATVKNWKNQASTPEMIDVTVKTPDDWREVKKRMTPAEDRVDWEGLRVNYPLWRKEGAWIRTGGWFGFDITHARMVGTERLLIQLVEDPEWIVDIWKTQIELQLGLYDQIWEAGYRFDEMYWPDDMGYKGKQFFSLRMYRELLKPIHQRAIDWAHAKGIKAYLHSCGDIRPFIPDLVAMGLDGLNPLEAKAGVDTLAVKREFGDKLFLHGGFNALLWADVDKMEAAVRSDLPILKQNGGYMFATDHSTPSNVSLEQFRRIVSVVKEVGRY
ncbi:MAG TPA: uroporphyrinogen decarboxylase family protein [Candidatus Brocadiia bacterium]|nr:uroporphyrinogen decarboxylase family protein [Candidatus Brocadiia bacterium]